MTCCVAIHPPAPGLKSETTGKPVRTAAGRARNDEADGSTDALRPGQRRGGHHDGTQKKASTLDHGIHLKCDEAAASRRADVGDIRMVR